MARLNFVKAARKDYPQHGIKKGEPYYWWKFMQGGRGGPKRYSKTKPRRSQLTQSEFLGTAYDIEDTIAAIAGYDNPDEMAGDLESAADEVRQLGEDCQDKLSNMPDGLQQGDSGQLLEQRAESCEDFASAIEDAVQEIRDAWQDLADGEEGGLPEKPEGLAAAELDTRRDLREKAIEECQQIVEGLEWSYE